MAVRIYIYIHATASPVQSSAVIMQQRERTAATRPEAELCCQASLEVHASLSAKSNAAE